MRHVTSAKTGNANADNPRQAKQPAPAGHRFGFSLRSRYLNTMAAPIAKIASIASIRLMSSTVYVLSSGVMTSAPMRMTPASPTPSKRLPTEIRLSGRIAPTPMTVSKYFARSKRRFANFSRLLCRGPFTAIQSTPVNFPCKGGPTFGVTLMSGMTVPLRTALRTVAGGPEGEINPEIRTFVSMTTRTVRNHQPVFAVPYRLHRHRSLGFFRRQYSAGRFEATTG